VTSLTGLGRLVRFVLRRDRLRLAIWIGGLAVLLVVSAASILEVYPDQEAVETYVRLFGDNPALVAFAGPGYGFDDPNIGVVLVNETQVYGCIAIALMSIFLVTRHTRAEEDSERADLVRSSVVGRHGPAAAALAVVGAANLAVGGLFALGLVALDYAVAGSIALAGSLVACGLMFAGITAVAAQVGGSGRATLGLASAALGVAFVLRAIGDVGDNAVSWVSPMGWAMAVRAYADERWWTLVLCAAVAGGLVALAFWLSTRRDLGAGLLPPRPGPPSAAGWITRPLGLAVRLQRGALAGWMLGLFVTGIAFGSIGEDLEELVEDDSEWADVLVQLEGVSITDSFLATSMTMLALMTAGFSISSALRLRSEEAAGRVEPILATPTSRWAWVAGHLTVAVVGTVATMAAAGLGVGVSYAVVSADAAQVPRLLGAAMVTVPAILVLAGAAVALFGLVPRAAMAAWALLALAAVVGYLGELLRLPEWVRQASPLEHVPALPAESLAAGPLVALTAVAAALVALGVVGFRRRDLRTE
jgi:ABC-2 type transport system permease protein